MRQGSSKTLAPLWGAGRNFDFGLRGKKSHLRHGIRRATSPKGRGKADVNKDRLFWYFEIWLMGYIDRIFVS